RVLRCVRSGLERRLPREIREPGLQLGRHRFDHDLPHVAAQLDLELVALAAVPADLQVRLGLEPLVLGQLAVEVGLKHLLAPVAGVDQEPSSVAALASSPLRIRRPRCNRDMTVPIGMSRMCAASWYEKSPMSTRTITSRKLWGTAERAST